MRRAIGWDEGKGGESQTTGLPAVGVLGEW